MTATGAGSPPRQPPTVAGLAIETLRALGVDTLFCLPGVQNDDFFDALVDARDIRPVVTRHEQGAAYMALGAAQVTGGPAALCVVPGPGMLNAAAGLTSAYWGNARVLALIGAVPSVWRGRSTGILHDLPDPAAVLRQLTKHTGYIGGGIDAAAVWQQAVDELVSGIPRPVAVEVPVDVWSQPADGVLDAPRAATPPIDGGQIEEAARVLGGAQRPLIMVGGGAQDASEPVRELAEMLEAPVFARYMGLGVLDTRHRLHAYLTMGRDLWPSSDVVVGIGTRMEFPNVEWSVGDDQQIVQINVDPDELDRYGTGTVGVHGDAAAACRLLIDALGRHNRRRQDRTGELAELRARHFERIAHLEPQLSYLRAIRSVMPDDGIIVEDVTQVAFVAHIAYEHRRPRTYLATGGAGTLGAGVAHGIGAAAAAPDRAQLTIVGDGGMLFTATELATAVQHGIDTTVLLFDNGAYGNVQRLQRQRFGPDRTIASTLRNPDWVAFGESFGVRTERVSGPDKLRAVLEASLAHPGPSMVVVDIADEPDPWPLLRVRR
ncbi:MAG: TPP-binding protein [Acidimicrobiaceae bacterium]|nr:TPP-binding protein [Acidimicrobiaceae bacterium]MXY12098.1 TPP-binding protein [Acidimicrobiaceae bacterium]MXZ67383.1 TPP-binding protein [Acidimicrobiaceae bacterium]MYF33944.1 TPP-binding protein [Acidimicrobiaceae bacterium]MYG78411.1 TPP-binding protein [Acidimicrobiaceae bacterium]